MNNKEELTLEEHIKALTEAFVNRQDTANIQVDQKDNLILRQQEAFIKQSEIILQQTKAITECMSTFKSFTDILMKIVKI